MRKPPPSGRRPAALKARRVAIDTCRENVAYLHRDCAAYRTEGFQTLAKIEVRGGGRHILAALNVVDDAAIVGPAEVGLAEQAFAQLGVAEGSRVEVAHAEPPASMDAVRRKIAGERLSAADYRSIVRDVTENHLSKTEIAAFLVATSGNELDRDEVLHLTRAMVETGERFDWHEPLVADKHCIGGLPGNRTSMIVVPIVAAHGMLIPKTSSRAITSPAGTADTMEVLARVELPIKALHDIVRRHRGCIAWGGAARLAPADDTLISVERPLRFDSQGQMVASILSKKLAAGASHILLDIPVGPTAKVRQMHDAQSLRRLFEYVGDSLGLHVEVVITDGRQPVGRGIGPVLEARDVMQVLGNDPAAPADLRQKALRLAGRVLEFDPDIRGGSGFAIARDILDSGRALAKMEAIVEAQGRRHEPLHASALSFDARAPASGAVVGIDSLQLARVARFAGAPMSKGAGVDLLKKLGEPVAKGEPLYRVHAGFPAELEFARALAARDSGFRIGAVEDAPGTDAEL